MNAPGRRQPFWRHSLRLYARPEVAQACLALQDDHGVDVNLVLLCCWLGRLGCVLGRRQLRQAQAAAAGWQHAVVQPLRAARRGLEPMGDAAAVGDAARTLRKRVAALELQAEFLEHELLRHWAEGLEAEPGARPATEATAANLRAYLGLAGVPGTRIEALLGVLEPVMAPAATGPAAPPRPAAPRRAR